jgi:hypothetical protein
MKKSILIIFIIFYNCGIKNPNINDHYRSHMISKGLDPDVERPFKHFEDFLEYRDSIKKQDLINNPYLKVNKVYVHYRSYDSFDIYVFGTNEQFSMKYNASVDDKNFELTPEGYVKTKQSVLISNYGGFRLNDDFLQTRRYSKSPHAEWYDYVNGTIKNDTIFMTEAYQGKDTYSFKKHWAASRKKRDYKIIYQPNFKVWVTTTHGSTVLTSFVIEGEFSIK